MCYEIPGRLRARQRLYTIPHEGEEHFQVLSLNISDNPTIRSWMAEDRLWVAY
jgi:hypothetical protein